MKYIKSKKLFEKKKYSHGLYTKESWYKFLNKDWVDIRISKNPKTIYFDVVDDIKENGEESNYTYEAYYKNRGKLDDIMIQDNKKFIDKLEKEFLKNPNLDNIEFDIECMTELKQLRNLEKFNI